MSSNLVSQDINVIRNLYMQSGKDRENTILLLNYFEKKDFQKSPLLEVYYGAALSMHAGQVEGNINKFKIFSSGKEKIELAVQLDKENVEIRFVRFMVQCNAPKFLNYNNIAEDKSMILKNLLSINKIENPDFVDMVYEVLLKSSYYTDTEKSIIRIYRNMPK